MQQGTLSKQPFLLEASELPQLSTGRKRAAHLLFYIGENPHNRSWVSVNLVLNSHSHTDEDGVSIPGRVSVVSFSFVYGICHPRDSLLQNLPM